MEANSAVKHRSDVCVRRCIYPHLSVASVYSNSLTRWQTCRAVFHSPRNSEILETTPRGRKQGTSFLLCASLLTRERNW